MSNFFSPIKLLYCHVMESHVRVSEEGPEGDREARLTLETGDPMMERAENGDTVLRSELTVDLSLRSRDTDEELFAVHVRAQGAVGTEGRQAELLGDQTELTLRANLISLLYGEMRTYVEVLTGMSPMGRFTLPTIDPYAYLGTISSEEA